MQSCGTVSASDGSWHGTNLEAFKYLFTFFSHLQTGLQDKFKLIAHRETNDSNAFVRTEVVMRKDDYDHGVRTFCSKSTSHRCFIVETSIHKQYINNSIKQSRDRTKSPVTKAKGFKAFVAVVNHY